MLATMTPGLWLCLIGAVALALFSVLLLGLLLFLAWLARGESDVNGDPERDGGLDDPAISRANACWDHGSRRAAGLLPYRYRVPRPRHLHLHRR